MAITWPVAVLSAGAVIDNPWGVCTQRAIAAGKILADVLYTRQQVGSGLDQAPLHLKFLFGIKTNACVF